MPGDGSNGELAALAEMMEKINLRQRLLSALVQNGMRLSPTKHKWAWRENLHHNLLALKKGAWRIR
jgi:hypothetical protein